MKDCINCRFGCDGRRICTRKYTCRYDNYSMWQPMTDVQIILKKRDGSEI